jgi:hypothetical protein
MKSKQILLAVLLTIGGADVAFSQGVLDAINNGTSALIYVDDSVHNGGVPVLIGTPAVAAGYSGAGPGEVSIFFYAAANGTSLSLLESSQSLVATTVNSSSTLAIAQGTINLGTLKLPNAPEFNGTSQIEVIAYAATAGGLTGWSSEATGLTPSIGIQPPTFLFGSDPDQISSFELTSTSPLMPIPEPSTLALGGLGAAALLAFRRRK